MFTSRNLSSIRHAVHRPAGLALTASLAITPSAFAQITNWQTGIVIPGTEAIAVEPQLILQNWNTIDHNLRFADLTGRDLHGSNFYQSWLDSARLNKANISNGFFGLSSLSNADLSHSNLSDSYFGEASLVAANLSSTDLSNAGMFENTNLTDANLTNANILGARFGAWFGGGSVAIGFTKEQLYSTASYQQRNLEEVALDKLNLTSWDFSHQNLKRAQFEGATLQDASFVDAIITNANFTNSTGFTKEQLYSTASYQQRNLDSVSLFGLNLSDWDLSHQNLHNVLLDSANLQRASFADANITNANFGSSTGFTKEQLYTTASYQNKDLQGINLYGLNLKGWNFSGMNLSRAALSNTTLTGADLSNAVITHAEFWATTNSAGLSKEQLYSTASYQQKNLQGIELWAKNLRDWDFSGQDLTNAGFNRATITNANFAGATIRGTVLGGTLGFNVNQLYSTASYQAKDLREIGLWELTLTGADLSGQDLTNAVFNMSRLTNANLSGANLTNASFNSATVTGANLAGAMISGNEAARTESTSGYVDFSFATGLTKEQLYSTASYQQKDLKRILFPNKNLTGWDFSGQNLTQSQFAEATLTGANFSDAIINGTSFGTNKGFTKEQLYSTASYKQKNLSGIYLYNQDASGWDFKGQNLTSAQFSQVNMNGADFSFADTRYGYFEGPFPDSALSRNTILSDGGIEGLNLLSGDRLVVRDFDLPQNATGGPTSIRVKNLFTVNDGGFLKLEFDADAWDSTIAFQPGISVQLGGTLELDFANGVDVTSQAGRTFSIFYWAGVTPTGQFTISSPYDWDLSQLYTTGQIVFQGHDGIAGDFDHDGTISAQDIDRLSQEIRSGTSTAAFDLNGDTLVNSADRTVWVHDLRKTYFGDANLDGLFNTQDLVSVFQAGQYEDTIAGNSGWATGDWDGDGDFTTSDLVSAFQDGGYEQGPRTAAATAAVPEPGAGLSMILTFGCLVNNLHLTTKSRRGLDR